MYWVDEVIELTALPATGWELERWSGTDDTSYGIAWSIRPWILQLAST